MAVKGPNHQMRTRIRGLTVLFALIGFGLVGVRLLSFFDAKVRRFHYI